MLRVTTIWGGSAQGLPYYSTHYFGGETSGEASAAIAAVDQWWQDLTPVVHNSLIARVQGEVENIQPDTGQIIGSFSLTGATQTGSASSEPLPWASQGLVRWRTGVFVNGREIRGRTFIPGPVESNNGAGTPSAGYPSTVDPAIATFLTGAVPAGDLVVYSRTHFQAATVASGSTWTQWAQTRSRRD